jgi:hypothetical protein
MRRSLQKLALLTFAALTLMNSGCATFDWLMDAEQRKNEWLRETFFGGGGGYQSFYGPTSDVGNPPCNYSPY